MAGEASAVEDMLRLEREAMGKLREGMKDLLAEIKTEREELRKDHDLVKDLVREYDRLGQRVSIQLQALVKIVEDMKRV